MIDCDMCFDQAAEKLGFDFSEIKIGGKYTSLIEHQGLAYISGQIPRVGDVVQVIGKVGQEVNLIQAQLAARISTMRALAILKQHYGCLKIIQKILQVNIFVHSAADLTQQSKVADGVSEILYEVFGLNVGKHTRTSVGVSQLPKNAAVEISFVVAISNTSIT